MTDSPREQLPIDPESEESWRPVDRAVVAAVFAGGALGGLARSAVQDALPLGLQDFPWPTLVINCTGAFALAVLVVHLRHRARARLVRPLLGTGFLGGWTTFGAVVVSADQQLAHDHAGLALAYLAATVAGGLLSALSGFLLARRTC